ncbi:MAG: BCCT family transporter [Porticoccaceae bacterium]|nr:BCCT family transporter [Porticoccaceae bacterium]
MGEARKAARTVILVPVFAPAVVVTVLLVAGTISNPELAGDVFSTVLRYITETFGWYYMLAVAFFLVFIVAIAFSSWGHIKLGPDHADPEYSFPSWFAMLFAAGYGIALLFFGVAEPVLHYAAPPRGAPETVDAARQAMQIAYFHWGFHIWAIYGLVGLVLAYFAFRHGLPLSMRSALYPLVGNHIYGPVGHVVDVFAILGTLFGIATTLGLSVAQINAGIHYLWPVVPMSVTVQILAILVISTLTIFSVVAGLDKGIKRLSILNMVMAGCLMLFVFSVGPTVHILESFLQNTGSYLNNIIERTFNLQAYSRSDWIGNWTLFIFGWTISWAPFVGLFIARISRGRTIRQFVVGVMVVPTVFTFLWFAIFGNTALHLIMNEGYTALIGEVQADHAIALFKLYEVLPLSSVVSLLTVVLIVIFFVTSSDSGALVIDSLASGGAAVTPAWQRVFWASVAGVVAATLLLAGGLSALQTMAIASALPFSVIMILAGFGLWRALVIEGYHPRTPKAGLQYRAHQDGQGLWRKRLTTLVTFPAQAEAEAFVSTTVAGAMDQVQRELIRQGWAAEVHRESQQRVSLTVVKEEWVDFLYEVRLMPHILPDYADAFDQGFEGGTEPDDNSGSASVDQLYYRAEVFLRRGGQAYDVYGFSAQEMITDILDQFERHLHFLHVSPGHLPWKMVEQPETK